MDGKLNMNFATKFSEVQKINENFLKAKCWVMALGKNRNKSNFEKEAVDDAYPTLKYVPLIGHLMQAENGEYYLGGHDSKVVVENGKYKLKSVCVPFGVAIPSDTPQYEEVVEKDGTVSTYLVSDVIIWAGRYPELTQAIYDANTWFGQSMEIIPMKTEKMKDDPDYVDVKKFSFDALCLLNKSDDEKFHVEPCFPSSKIGAYSVEKEIFTEMFEELKEELKFCLENNSKGEDNLNKKLEILEKFGKKVEELDFSIEDMSVEDLEAKLTEMEAPVQTENFSTTYRQKRELLCSLFSDEFEKDEEGKIVKEVYYYIDDFDDTYVYVDIFTYMEGKRESKYIRYTYTIDEAESKATLGESVEMVKMWLTIEEKEAIEEQRSKYELMSVEYEEYKASHSHENEEVESLAKFKADTIAEAEKAEKLAVLDKFAKELSERAEYKGLLEEDKYLGYSTEELKKECIYIRGLYAELPKATDGAIQETGTKFSLEEPKEDKKDSFMELYAKYLNK